MASLRKIEESLYIRYSNLLEKKGLCSVCPSGSKVWSRNTETCQKVIKVAQREMES